MCIVTEVTSQKSTVTSFVNTDLLCSTTPWKICWICREQNWTYWRERRGKKKGTLERKPKDSSYRKSEEKMSRKAQFYCKQHVYNNAHETRIIVTWSSKRIARNKQGLKQWDTRDRSYLSKEEVHAMIHDVAETSAKAAVMKAAVVWRKRKHEDNHALEAVTSAINRLE